MSRKYKKGDVLNIDTVYGYGQSDNQFEVLCIHNDYIWVEWQSDETEVETLYLDASTRKNIIILNVSTRRLFSIKGLVRNFF